MDAVKKKIYAPFGIKTKARIFSALVMICFIMPAYSQTEVGKEDSIRFSQELIAIEQRLMDDIPLGDTRNWDKYLHKEFFIITEDGTRLDKNAFLKTFRPLPKGYSGYIKVVQPKTMFYLNVGIINYVSDEYEHVFESKIHTQYSSLNTYLKKDGSWIMLSSQVFEIPMLPAALKISAQTLKRYVGIYQLSDSNTCAITFEKDTLFYERNGRSKIALLAETETIFFRTPDARGRKLFVKDNLGRMLMKERRNGQDVIWTRIKK